MGNAGIVNYNTHRDQLQKAGKYVTDTSRSRKIYQVQSGTSLTRRNEARENILCDRCKAVEKHLNAGTFEAWFSVKPGFSCNCPDCLDLLKQLDRPTLSLTMFFPQRCLDRLNTFCGDQSDVQVNPILGPVYMEAGDPR